MPRETQPHTPSPAQMDRHIFQILDEDFFMIEYDDFNSGKITREEFLAAAKKSSEDKTPEFEREELVPGRIYESRELFDDGYIFLGSAEYQVELGPNEGQVDVDSDPRSPQKSIQFGESITLQCTDKGWRLVNGSSETIYICDHATYESAIDDEDRKVVDEEIGPFSVSEPRRSFDKFILPYARICVGLHPSEPILYLYVKYTA